MFGGVWKSVLSIIYSAYQLDGNRYTNVNKAILGRLTFGGTLSNSVLEDHDSDGTSPGPSFPRFHPAACRVNLLLKGITEWIAL